MDNILDLFSNHPVLLWMLLAVSLTIAFSQLFLKKNYRLMVLLISLLNCAIYFLYIAKQEQRWQKLNEDMFRTYQLGEKEKSLEIAKQLLEIARANFSSDSVRTVESVHHVGWLLVNSKRFKEAESYFDESIAGYLKLDPNFPDDHHLVCTHGVGNERALLGLVYKHTSRPELARKFYLEALEHYRRRCPSFPQYQAEMTNALGGLP